jgi:hypothetical protein
MSNYKIIITNYDDPHDIGEIIFSQSEMDAFLDSCAPYNEKAILEASENIDLIPVVTIKVETAKDLFQWHNKYYTEETFTLMVLDAVKKNTLAMASYDVSVESPKETDWKKEREEAINEVMKAYENRRYE